MADMSTHQSLASPRSCTTEVMAQLISSSLTCIMHILLLHKSEPVFKADASVSYLSLQVHSLPVEEKSDREGR